jgi:hypothetical protein
MMPLDNYLGARMKSVDFKKITKGTKAICVDF